MWAAAYQSDDALVALSKGHHSRNQDTRASSGDSAVSSSSALCVNASRFVQSETNPGAAVMDCRVFRGAQGGRVLAYDARSRK